MKTIAGEHKDIAALVGVPVSNVRHALVHKAGMVLSPVGVAETMTFTVETGRWLIITTGALSVRSYDESGTSLSPALTDPDLFSDSVEMSFTRGDEPVLPVGTGCMSLRGDLFLILPSGSYTLTFASALPADDLSLNLTVRLSGFMVSADEIVVDGTLLLSVS